MYLILLNALDIAKCNEMQNVSDIAKCNEMQNVSDIAKCIDLPIILFLFFQFVISCILKLL
jgi:hypothetical protein